MSKGNPRTTGLVHEALADLIESSADPRLRFVTVTEVDLSPDHDVATVYYSSLEPDVLSEVPSRTRGDEIADAEEVADALASSAGRLRSLLIKRVKLRRAPELRFRPDPVVASADRVESLLRAVRRDNG